MEVFMKRIILFSIFLVFFISIYSCNDSTNPVTGLTNVATEIWKSFADGDTINSGTWNLYKKSDNSKTIVGTWKETDDSNIVSCPFNEGPLSMTIFDSTFLISFNASGTATNSGLPPGFQTSPFNLKVSGMGNLINAVGNYTIKFTATGWPDSVTGYWNAIKQSGSGVSH
jgi:hypothetical protein